MAKQLTCILLVEDDPADAEFIRGALLELEQLYNAQPWLSRVELTHCESLAEASEVLQEVHFDVILLDLGLGDSGGLDTFHQIHNAAPDCAILVLSAVDDPSLAVHLMREGAQDFLLKQELDCIPLGRAMRSAMERNRVSSGLRRLAIRDELTGMLNEAGFHNLADQQSRVLRRCAVSANLILLRVENLNWITLVFGRHQRDWLILEISELFRGLAGEADLVAHFGNGSFALLTLDHSIDKASRYCAALGSKISNRAERNSTMRPVEIRMGQAELGAGNLWDLATAIEVAEASVWRNVADPLSCQPKQIQVIPSITL